jgi:hypothetical protein
MAAAVHEQISRFANCTVADHSFSHKNEKQTSHAMALESIDNFGHYEPSPGDESAGGLAQAVLRGPTMRLAATLLRGRTVTNYDNEDLGVIEDFMLDMETGHPGYAVLSFAGALDGRKLVPVPIRALAVDTGGDRFMLNADREMLRFAPAFDCRNWPDTSDPRWRSGIDSYYRF